MSDPAALVDQCQLAMAHAWMVRTFVKHSPEAEDFPELMGIARTIFDLSRALETRVADSSGYFRMLGKKLHRLRSAVDQFAIDAPQASTHTNFAQAVISIRGVLEALERLQQQSRQALPPAANPVAAPLEEADAADEEPADEPGN